MTEAEQARLEAEEAARIAEEERIAELMTKISMCENKKVLYQMALAAVQGAEGVVSNLSSDWEINIKDLSTSIERIVKKSYFKGASAVTIRDYTLKEMKKIEECNSSIETLVGELDDQGSMISHKIDEIDEMIMDLRSQL